MNCFIQSKSKYWDLDPSPGLGHHEVYYVFVKFLERIVWNFIENISILIPLFWVLKFKIINCFHYSSCSSYEILMFQKGEKTEHVLISFFWSTDVLIKKRFILRKGDKVYSNILHVMKTTLIFFYKSQCGQVCKSYLQTFKSLNIITEMT